MIVPQYIVAFSLTCWPEEPTGQEWVTRKLSGIESFEQLPKKKNATNQKFIAF
jgi:hypothetical protein